MPLDARELKDRVQKLRKSMRSFSRDATVDEVHHLRTRTRHVESILQAVEMDASRNVRKLLTGLKAVRKRAGKVRDADVFTSYIVGLGLGDDPNCVVRLVHHLGGQRQRDMHKLHYTVQDASPELRRRLKRYRRKLNATLERFAKSKSELEDKTDDQVADSPLHAMNVALQLCKKLAEVQRLGVNNLHAYRIEVKRLRYLLEMADVHQEEQKAFIAELRHVQNAIGEWHDWVELGAIAHDVLICHRGCKLLFRIADISHKKYLEALRITQQMRRRFLPTRHSKASSVDRRSQSSMPGPVLVATSEIAA